MSIPRGLYEIGRFLNPGMVSTAKAGKGAYYLIIESGALNNRKNTKVKISLKEVMIE